MNELIGSGSYLAIFSLIFLTGAGLPIPEEVPVVAAGIFSSPDVGKMIPWLAYAVCVLGAISGDSLMYWIGRGLGKSRLREHRWFSRMLNEEREEQMEQLMSEHGLKIFMVARFLVGVRAPLYLAAGMTRIKYRRFLLTDLVCATLVVSVFFWLSYFFGGWIGPLIRESQIAATIVVGVIAVGAAVYYACYKRFRRKMNGAQTEVRKQTGRRISEHPRQPVTQDG